MRRLSQERCLIFLLLCLPFASAHAFKPTANHGHAGITENSMQGITRIDSTGTTLEFSERAIEQVQEAVAHVDDLISGEFWIPAAHCDNETLPACTQRLIDLKQQAINALKGSEPNGELARQLTGRALHTLQDFYAHSNWVFLNGSTANSVLGSSTIPRLGTSQDTCERGFGFQGAGTYALHGLTSLTTGYFNTVPLNPEPDGKCQHGFGFQIPTARIMKDVPEIDYSGQGTHAQARAAAVASTSHFVSMVLDAPEVSSNDKALRAYMDVDGSLGFVIDNTGSMGGEINGVKGQVSAIVNLTESLNRNPDKYILVSFNDPSVGVPVVTTDASVLLSAVNSLFAYGGGDCPELAMTGMGRAVDEASPSSDLFLFTDASAKDSGLWPHIAARAKAKDVRIWSFIYGSCSPIDPAYFGLSTETGGQLIEMYRGATETAKIFDLIKPGVTESMVPVLVATGDNGATGQRIVEFPVDSSMNSLIVSMTGDNFRFSGTATLLNPAGVPINMAMPDVKLTEIKGGVIYTIDNPTVGAWRAQLDGAGNYYINVQVVSDIEFGGFDFVEERGRAEHTGYFPLVGEPVTAGETLGLARLYGDISSVNFFLTDEHGTKIKNINLQSNDEVAPGEYLGSFTLPGRRFRVVAIGQTPMGDQFMRTFSSSYVGQSVKVEAVNGAFLDLTPGSVVTQRFKVTNLGLRDTFNISAENTNGFISSYTPTSVTLDANGNAIIEVTLSIPASTPVGTVVTLSVLAEGFSSANNTVVAHVIRSERLKGDIDDDNDVDVDDMQLILAIKNTDISGSSDIRDIDKNGRVNAFDARKLVSLCTRSKCARE